MKLSTMFLIIFAIQFNVLIFASSYNHDTLIFGFIQNPTDWSNSALILVVTSIAAGAALTGSYIGSLIIGKNDLTVFATVIGLFISWASPITSLWQMIYEEVNLFGTASGLIASIFVAPLIIIAFFAVLGWWRGNSNL
jgi:hypothetical protein